MYPPPMYPPPVYTQPIYQMPPSMYVPTYSPAGITTPHFQSTDDKEKIKSPEQTLHHQKLVFDVGTSPASIIEEHILEIKPEGLLEEQVLNGTPERDPKLESNIKHSFAASPSDKTEAQNKSSVVILDPITRAW